jgi:uroporphyrinogen-III synthase
MTKIKVLVTRPQQQSQKLCSALHARNIIPLQLPTLTIKPVAKTLTLQTTLDQLFKTNIVIFVSPNAVQYALPLLGPEHLAVLKQLKIAAIGPGTAKQLSAAGLNAILMSPQQFNSDGLLRLAELQDLTNQHIIIFCGDNSRQQLAESLKQRGATVLLAIVYQCSPPKQLAKQLAALINEIDMILATSKQCINNLWLAAKHRQKDLSKIPLLVSSERLKSYAQELNFKQVIIAENATDAALCAALEQWKPAYD